MAGAAPWTSLGELTLLSQTPLAALVEKGEGEGMKGKVRGGQEGGAEGAGKVRGEEKGEGSRGRNNSPIFWGQVYAPVDLTKNISSHMS